MKIGLYVAMVVLGLMAVWGNSKGKSGAAWGRGVAAVCGILTLLAALAAIALTINPRWAEPDYAARERQVQYVAFKFLGKEIARQHPDAKILLLRQGEMAGVPAEGTTTEQEQLRGLKEGLGRGATIEREVKLTSDAEIPEGADPDMGPMPMDPMAMLNAEKFDAIIRENEDCDVILSMVGLPYDTAQMKYWERAKDGEDVPKLVLVNTELFNLKPAIEAGVVTIVLAANPEPFDYKASLPEAEQEIFDQRYIIITPENVDAMAEKFSQLVPESK